MSAAQEFEKANEAYVADFGYGELPMPPGRRVAVLTCMDARLDPAAALGLEPGDAHVIRNAGGRASDDALRSLIISQNLLGTQEIVVIHHTDCGMVTFSDEQLHAQLNERTGQDASHIAFLAFGNASSSVQDDIAAIQASPFIDASQVTGYIYDVSSGAISKVV